jgi:hypothetical protein
VARDIAADAAVAHEPSGHGAEELQEGDREQTCAGVRHFTIITNASMSDDNESHSRGIRLEPHLVTLTCQAATTANNSSAREARRRQDLGQ